MMRRCKMSIVGIGIDAVELNRIQSAMEKGDAFVRRVLTEQEYLLFLNGTHTRRVEFVAGRFAAKEAFSKALKTGIGKDLSFQDIEILPNEKGAPILYQHIFNGIVHISITHTKTDAYAVVMLENE